MKYIRCGFLLIQRKIAEIVYRRKINENQDVHILVFLHLYYSSLIPVILGYIKNLEVYHYDLIVTFDEKRDISGLEKIKRVKPDAVFLPCDNRGFDIGPFFEALGKVDLSHYDLVIKLQSKGKKRRLYTNGQFFKGCDWFLYLFEGVLGPFQIHNNIEILRNNGQISIIAAKNLIVTDPVHKEHFTAEQLSRHNLSINFDYHFVAGTCFIAKAQSLRELQQLSLTICDFEESEQGYFSFAHAMERYLTGRQTIHGGLYGVTVCRTRQWLRRGESWYWKKFSGMRLCEDKRFILSDDFVLRWLEHHLVLKYEVIDIPVEIIRGMGTMEARFR